VESGNLLFAQETLAEHTATGERMTAEAIIRATAAMGGGIAGVGTRDLAAGVAFLQHQEPAPLTWLSLNLVDPLSRKPLFPQVLFHQAGPLKVALLALTDHGPLAGRTEAVLALPWQDVLPGVLAEIGTQADFVVLLSNYPLAENRTIARNHGAINLILQSGQVMGNLPPMVIHNALIAQTGPRGQYLGVLDLHWNGSGQWTREIVGVPELNPGSLSTYRNQFIALRTSLRPDPEVEALVQQTQRRIAQAQTEDCR
jgi:2',3'-cyclic-nucleotide 2'-phosphodiesterase (5'-nucleotidase family)